MFSEMFALIVPTRLPHNEFFSSVISVIHEFFRIPNIVLYSCHFVLIFITSNFAFLGTCCLILFTNVLTNIQGWVCVVARGG